MLALVVVGSSAWAGTPSRVETSPGFAIDEAFQADGGVQLFYELVKSEAPPAKSATFAAFRPLDAEDHWATLAAPTHVVMMRVVYELEKDASFFNDTRVHDLRYVQAVAPDMDVSSQPDGGFRIGRAPANDAAVAYLDGSALEAAKDTPGIARALAWSGTSPWPASVVHQRNSGFSRIMGVKTGELSVTWTVHQALAPGRTRVSVTSLAYLHSLPPFFLGGEDRVRRESLDGALALVERLRSYAEPLAAR